jgi:hypothetical protein
MTGTDIVNLVFTGISGSIDINGGTALRFKDATNVDEVNMSHDGTDFLVIPSINTIDLMLGDEVSGLLSRYRVPLSVFTTRHLRRMV